MHAKKRDGQLVASQAVNWGDTQEVTGSKSVTLARVQLDDVDACPMMVYAEAYAIALDPRVRPFVDIEWGNGGASLKMRCDATKRLRVPLVASTVIVTGFLLTDDGSFDPAPANAKAKFSGFVVPGVDGETQLPSTYSDPFQPADTGQILIGAQRATGIWGSNEGATQAWIMIFDADVASAPALGDAPVLVPANVAAGDTFSYDLPNSFPFTRGIWIAVSSTPGTLTPLVGGLVAAQAEVLE